MPAALKLALEDLLRNRSLAPSVTAPEGRRLAPLASGVRTIDALLAGGFPRGHVSEVHGPASSGRTGLALGVVAQLTRQGMLAAWIDPQDRFDPASAAAAGVDLARLLWLRSAALKTCVTAAATLLGSGLFELVVLDLAAVARGELLHLPNTTWTRFARIVEGTPVALLVLATDHVATSPRGVALRLRPGTPRWGGGPGAGRFLDALPTEAALERGTHPCAAFERRISS